MVNNTVKCKCVEQQALRSSWMVIHTTALVLSFGLFLTFTLIMMPCCDIHPAATTFATLEKVANCVNRNVKPYKQLIFNKRIDYFERMLHPA